MLLLALAFSSLGSTPANAAMTNTGSCSNAITVTSANDSGAGTLRQAITDICVGGAITFGQDTAITLTTGAPTIAKNLSIDGTGHTVSVDGNNADRVFEIDSGTVSLTGLTIQHGKVSNLHGSAGGIFNYGTLTITNSTISANASSYGGGIYNQGSLTVTNSTFSGNSATEYGGGIFNNGTLTVTDSTFSANSTHGDGGGIDNSGGTLTVTNSTFSANSANNGSGGGLYNGGTLTITNSTFSANASGYDGGGIFNDGTLTVTNSTFSGNSATEYAGGIGNAGTLAVTDSTFSANSAGVYGGGIYTYTGHTTTVTNSTFSANSANNGSGGIYNAGTLTVTNSTFSANSAPWGTGGGIYSNEGAPATLKNTLLANSTRLDKTSSNGNCAGAITDGGNNLDTGTTCGFSAANNSLSSSDPKLGALADNGGTTQTFALLSGSAAIDTGDDTVCAAAPVNNLDQRGIARPQYVHCDIGAYEYVLAATATPTATATSTATSTATVTPTTTITVTPTTTITVTPTTTITVTPTTTITVTPTTTITVTPTTTAAATSTATSTATATPTTAATSTATATATATAVAGVDIVIGGADKGISSLPQNTYLNKSFSSLINGPVDVFSSDSSTILASQRATSGQSYNEVMGLPTNQLSTDYWFPAYDHSFIPGSNTNPMRMWVMVDNLSTTQSATVKIYIGGVLQAMSPFSVPAGGRVSTRWIGGKGGPVEVVSSSGVKILASERVLTSSGNAFNEILGVPASQLSSEYWFPYYDNLSMSNAIQVGNPSANKAVKVDIYIGGIKKGSYNIPAHGYITRSYPNLAAGPLRVVSTNGLPVVTSQIALSGANNAFNEVMGFPANQLTTEYWFPVYDHSFIPGNNTNPMRMWVMVSNPSTSLPAAVDIYIAGIKMAGSPFSIPAGGQVTPRWIGATNGPVRVVSTNGTNILTSERVMTYPGSGFNEMMGYPRNQMSNEYWFPYYDSVSTSNDILVSRP